MQPTPSTGVSSFDHLQEDRVFQITLKDPQQMKRKWPPSPLFLFLVAVPLLFFPVGVLVCFKYREERQESASTMVLLGDTLAMWILEQVPILTAKIFTLHVAACLGHCKRNDVAKKTPTASIAGVKALPIPMIKSARGRVTSSTTTMLIGAIYRRRVVLTWLPFLPVLGYGSWVSLTIETKG